MHASSSTRLHRMEVVVWNDDLFWEIHDLKMDLLWDRLFGADEPDEIIIERSMVDVAHMITETVSGRRN